MPQTLLLLALVLAPGADLLQQADLALHDKRNEDAVRLYRQARAQDPAVLPETWGLGMALYGLGRLDEARTELDAILDRHPDHPRARYGRGLVALRQGRPKEAEADLRAVLAARPDDVRAWYRLGQALHGQGRTGEAVSALRAALDRRFVHQPARHALVMALRDAGHLDEARAEAELFERVAPLVDRIRRAEASLARSPDDPRALLAVGRLYARVGNAAGAVRVLERATALRPGHEPTLQALSRARALVRP